jgi:hypothetical protein
VNEWRNRVAIERRNKKKPLVKETIAKTSALTFETESTDWWERRVKSKHSFWIISAFIQQFKRTGVVVE